MVRVLIVDVRAATVALTLKGCLGWEHAESVYIFIMSKITALQKTFQ